MRYDQGSKEDREAIHKIVTNYLKKIYPGWTEEAQIYNKYED